MRAAASKASGELNPLAQVWFCDARVRGMKLSARRTLGTRACAYQVYARFSRFVDDGCVIIFGSTSISLDGNQECTLQLRNRGRDDPEREEERGRERSANKPRDGNDQQQCPALTLQQAQHQESHNHMRSCARAYHCPCLSLILDFLTSYKRCRSHQHYEVQAVR